MRIVIDLQACQSTGSRHRGIGRYSLALAKAMARNAGSHELCLLLNGLFADTIGPIRKEFSSLVPRQQTHVWNSPGPVADLYPENEWRARAAELVREQALANLRPDFVHVTSLFEGSGDDAVVSIGKSGEYLPTAVTLYDLIPLVYAKQYLGDSQQRQWYFRQLQALKMADLSLAISESSRQEGMQWLQLPPDRVVNISSAVDEHFKPVQYAQDASLALQLRYGLRRPFVMYTGGIDLRKNIETLIRSFASLDAATRAQYQLAIVCSAQPHDRERLLAVAAQAGLGKDEVVLTGFVSEEDLLALYNHCALFVFPSWHEGFGLPALEAMACGAAVIGANTSSLPEVIGRADAMFDPRDEASIAAKMQHALSDKNFNKHLRDYGLQRAQQFSWDASAKRAIAAMEDSHQRNKERPVQIVALQPGRTKPKLAYISPLPPERSGIADYSAELLPELARYYDIELITAHEQVSDCWLTSNFPVRTSQWFDEHAKLFDRVLYHFGNSPFHSHMFELLQRHPGVVVQHDFFLSGVIANLEMTGAMPEIWTRALYASHGYQALIEKHQASSFDSIIWKYPSNLPVLAKAEGIIVHSRHASQMLRDWYGSSLDDAVQVLPLIRKLPATTDKAAARVSLGLPPDGFVVCTFGALSPTKLNSELLQAWCSSGLGEGDACHLVFVGTGEHDPVYSGRLQSDIDASGCAERVLITGYADAGTFHQYLSAADVAVQLRSMSRGETSAAALDCLNYGLPTIVNAHGSMAELPDDCVVKLPDVFNIQDLAEQLQNLRNNTAMRASLAEAGRLYMRKNHVPEEIAASYFAAIEGFALTHAASRLHRNLAVIANLDTAVAATEQDLIGLARHLAAGTQTPGLTQILIDVTCLVSSNNIPLPVGLLQNLRLLIQAMIASAPLPYRVEPVVLTPAGFCYARVFTYELLGLPVMPMLDEVIEINPHDVLLSLELSSLTCESTRQALSQLGLLGVTRYLLMPDCWSEGSGDAGVAALTQQELVELKKSMSTMNGVFTQPATMNLGAQVATHEWPLQQLMNAGLAAADAICAPFWAQMQGA